MSTLKHIKRITSYAGHARFLAECRDAPVGVIDRQADIPSPYAYGQEWTVLRHTSTQRLVVIRETAHRQYDVFLVPQEMLRGIK